MSCNDAECSSFTKSFWDGYLQCQLYRRPGHVYTMHCPYKDHEICKCSSESWSNCDDFTNSIKSWKQSLEFYIYTYKPHVWDDIISSTTIIHPDSILSPCPPFFREAPSKLDPLENSHAHQRSIPMVPGVVDCRKGWIPNGWNTFWNKSVSIHVLNRDILKYPWKIFFHWVPSDRTEACHHTTYWVFRHDFGANPHQDCVLVTWNSYTESSQLKLAKFHFHFGLHGGRDASASPGNLENQILNKQKPAVLRSLSLPWRISFRLTPHGFQGNKRF